MDVASFYGTRAKFSPDVSDESDLEESEGDLGEPSFTQKHLESATISRSGSGEIATETNGCPTGTNKRSTNGPARALSWKKVRCDAPYLSQPQWKCALPPDMSVQRPTDYFRAIVDESLPKFVVEQFNFCSMQRDPNKPQNLTRNELEQFLGVSSYTAIIKLPNTRLYWSKECRIPQVANTL